MKQYRTSETFNSYDLRNLCIKNDLFTCGTNEQYSKMFKAADEGASADDLATMIWMCSEGYSRTEIKEMIEQLNIVPISLDSVHTALSCAGFGPTEIEIIIDALGSHQDNGTAYRTI